tara:strand:+ start:749 stop:871 length:123 start_codon:yes stop_codon:yes gene_type:complete
MVSIFLTGFLFSLGILFGAFVAALFFFAVMQATEDLKKLF